MDITNDPRKMLGDILTIAATMESNSRWTSLEDTVIPTTEDANEY
jgi:hypothetical protein